MTTFGGTKLNVLHAMVAIKSSSCNIEFIYVLVFGGSAFKKSGIIDIFIILRL